jgi:hypothetical protein
MTRRTTLLTLLFLCVSLLRMLPGLSSFFDPQDFYTFLNPLARGDSFSEYMLDGWSWHDGETGVRIGFFRPLTSLTYIPEHFAWGSSPLPYRLTSLLFHAAACLVVFALCRGFKGNGIAAGLLAAAAPGTVYAVWLINGRGDVMAPLFGLAAVAAAIGLTGRERNGLFRSLLPGLLCLLAMASKEQGMASVPACVLAWILVPGGSRSRKTTVRFAAGLLCASALYLGARLIMFRGVGGYGNLVPWSVMPRHLLVLVFQFTGAGLIPWRIARWAYLLLLALPVTLYGASSRRNLRITLFLLLLIPLFGFQSIVGDTCSHYIFAPAVVFALLLGVSLGFFSRVIVTVVTVLLLSLWVVLGLGESARLDSITAPFEKAHAASREVLPHLIEGGAEEPVLVYLDPESRGDPLLSETKNIPVYLDHLSGGLAPFRTGALAVEATTGEWSVVIWVKRHWEPGEEGISQGTVLIWDGDSIEVISSSDFRI